jgi:hypothetical protein
MRIACWVTNATKTHSDYVKLIAFPRQQLLRERTSVLGLHFACLVILVGGLKQSDPGCHD